MYERFRLSMKILTIKRFEVQDQRFKVEKYENDVWKIQSIRFELQ